MDKVNISCNTHDGNNNDAYSFGGETSRKDTVSEI